MATRYLSGISGVPSVGTSVSDPEREEREQQLWEALIAAGGGILSSKGNFSQQIGAGLQSGLAAYRQGLNTAAKQKQEDRRLELLDEQNEARKNKALMELAASLRGQDVDVSEGALDRASAERIAEMRSQGLFGGLSQIAEATKETGKKDDEGSSKVGLTGSIRKSIQGLSDLTGETAGNIMRTYELLRGIIEGPKGPEDVDPYYGPRRGQFLPGQISTVPPVDVEGAGFKGNIPSSTQRQPPTEAVERYGAAVSAVRQLFPHLQPGTPEFNRQLQDYLRANP